LRAHQLRQHVGVQQVARRHGSKWGEFALGAFAPIARLPIVSSHTLEALAHTLQPSRAVVLCGRFQDLSQDHTRFLLHRPPVLRRAQAQALLEAVVEIADGERRHGGF